MEELKSAVREADCTAIVDELSTWTEAQRNKAVQPVKQVIEDIESPDIGASEEIEAIEEQIRAAAGAPDSSEIVQKLLQRSAEIGQLQYGSSRLQNRDARELVMLGVGRLKDVRNINHRILRRIPREALRILLDRKPKWLPRWLQTAYRKNVEGIPLDTWLTMFRAGLTEWDESNVQLAVHIAGKLPKLIQDDPAIAEELMKQVPEIADIVYRVPQLDIFTMYECWSPLVQQRNEAGHLDRRRLIRSVIDGLNMNFKQNHRRDSIGLAVLTEPSAEEWSDVQNDLRGLLSHTEPFVVGFALEQLNVVDRVGMLDREAVIPELASAFELKPKKHVVSAVNLLERIGEDPALRSTAVATAVAGLSHSNADVRDWVMQMLTKQLSSEDSETIEILTQNEPTFAASIRPGLRELLKSVTGSSDGDSALSAEQDAPIDLDSWQQQLQETPESIRSLLCLSDAIDAAQQGRIDSRCDWPVMSGKTLVSSEAVQPIETLEELIDTVMAAIEQLDSPDEFPRILDAIARFADQRPDDFEKRTAALKQRISDTTGDPPYRGLLFGDYGGAITRVLLLWLIDNADSAERDEAVEYVGTTFVPRDCIIQLLNHVAQHAAERKSCVLLCTPTHTGGWIDPGVWVERLLQLQRSEGPCNTADFAKSALRLAPDERSAQLSKLSELEQPYRDLATCALGGQIDFTSTEGDPILWVAACRARDVTMTISSDAPFARGLFGPDMVRPYEYDWRKDGPRISDFASSVSHFFPVVQDMAGTYYSAEAELRLRDDTDLNEEDAGVLQDWLQGEQKRPYPGSGHPSAEVHTMAVLNNPGWFFPWLSTHWPAKLDWYWFHAVQRIAHRINAKASAFDQGGQFLLPLYERDRPLTPMSARALWAGTLSTDPNARTPAIDIWIELINDGRADIRMLCEALWDIAEWGVAKYVRIAAACYDIVPISPLHTWTMAEIVQQHLGSTKELPRNVLALLTPLLDWLSSLGLPVAEPLPEKLTQFRSGKTKKVAQALLALTETASPVRAEAANQFLAAKFERAKRFA